MSVRTYDCSICGWQLSEERPMTDPAEFSIVRYCPNCKVSRTHERAFTASYLAAGLLTKRYTGQEYGAKGWGTHTLDYGKAGSDLVQGRANEYCAEKSGKYPRDTRFTE